MTAVTANANMPRIRSHGSSIASRNIDGGSHRLWLSARALVMNNSGSEDLWLSATGAVVNGGRWLRGTETSPEAFCSRVFGIPLKELRDGQCFAFNASAAEPRA